jgi:hypothetical protein
LSAPLASFFEAEPRYGASYKHRNPRLQNSRQLLQPQKPSLPKESLPLGSTGLLPANLDFELASGKTDSIAVSESDISLLVGTAFEVAKHRLSLILDARQGDSTAAGELSVTTRANPSEVTAPEPTENVFIVPCTSRQAHAQQSISHKASILLKLCQLGYPVPEFVVLTAQAYIERDHGLGEHLADALAPLEILTG